VPGIFLFLKLYCKFYKIKYHIKSPL